MTEIRLRKRPFFIRIWRGYRGFRHLGLKPMPALRAAWKVQR